MNSELKTEQAIINGSQLMLKEWGYPFPLIKTKTGELKEMETKTNTKPVQNQEQATASFKPCGWMNMAKSGKCLTLSIGPQGEEKRYTVFCEDVQKLMSAEKKGIRISEVIKTV